MESINSQNGDAIWLSSADKKYVLTYSDKAEIERLMSIHCGDIDFEENFKKACKTKYKNTGSLLNDVHLVYQNYLNGIMDQYQKALADCTSGKSMVDAEYINYISDIKRFKLEATYRHCLSEIYQVTNSDFQINDFLDGQAKIFNEILNRVKNIEKQTENKVEPNNVREPLPELEALNKLTEGKEPVLRKWEGGKYKCSSLERFIKAYIKIANNLTPALIRDYLISERFNKPYSKDSIETALKNYGPADRKIIRS